MKLLKAVQLGAFFCFRREMTGLESKIWEMLVAGVEDLNLRLVRVRITGGSEHCKLQVMIEPQAATADNPLSVTMDECTAVSRMTSALLDVEDPIQGKYELEVSSTGLERPLVTAEDFTNYSNHRAKVEMNHPHNGKRKFVGTLLGLQGNEVAIQANDEVVNLQFDEIKFAHLAFTDEEVRQIMKNAEAK